MFRTFISFSLSLSFRRRSAAPLLRWIFLRSVDLKVPLKWAEDKARFYGFLCVQLGVQRERRVLPARALVTNLIFFPSTFLSSVYFIFNLKFYALFSINMHLRLGRNKKKLNKWLRYFIFEDRGRDSCFWNVECLSCEILIFFLQVEDGI